MSPAPSFKEKEDSSRKLSVPDDAPPRDYRFWLVFVGIGLSFILTALELSAVATALPRIASDLHASTFVWVGSAYALAATAFIPLAGGLAQIFGRRAVVLSSLAIMIAGSAMAGAAPNMNFLIAARTVQGLGGGGVSAATAIILSDLVPLHERGVFNGIIGIFWSVASVVGPIVGGALGQGGQWRWLFYLNIPFACAAMLLFFVFLRVPSPAGTIVEKAARVDWLGSLFIIAATASCCVALAWSGVEHAWVSTPVLVPLILGLVGLVACVVYETLLPKYPVVPFSLMSQRTGASGYLQTFISSLVLLGVTYYVPVYFQACKELSPIGSGVGLLAFAAFLGIGGILSGVSVKKTGHYRPQLWIAWALIVIGLGAYTTLNADSSRINAIALLIVSGTGMGMLVTTTYFPVLAPIPVSFNAPALAYFMFLRNFAQVWGITIGGAVLQNQLSKRIPQAFLSQFSQGTAIAYASIPLIPDLSEPLKTEVRTAFADSLRIVWLVNLAFAGIGLLASTLMKHLPLHTTIDKDWALEGAPQDLPSPDLERSGQKE